MTDKVKTVELRRGPLGREDDEVCLAMDVVIGRGFNSALITYIDWPSIIPYGAPPDEHIIVDNSHYIAMYIDDELQWWAANGEVIAETNEHGWQVMVKEKPDTGGFEMVSVKYGAGKDVYYKP